MKAKPLLTEIDFAKYERLVVLSPHLDDAALSCHGLLEAVRKKIPRLVITVCCSQPPKPGTNKKARDRRGFAPPKQRRAEDIAAMEAMKCSFVHLGFPDAIHRRSASSGNFVYTSEETREGELRLDDANYIEELYLILSRLCCNMGPLVLVSPLGIGRHVDHLVCAQVAMRLVKANIKLLFYEDLPYAWRGSQPNQRQDSSAAAFERLGLLPGAQYYVDTDVYKKASVMKCYSSQVPLLFNDDEEMLDAFRYATVSESPKELFWSAKKEKGGTL
ncbi:MAG: PIG-L family deacetylase [Bdellovibrionales bacterium]|nr:PIG-L family deacetylase [Bdellovibrionales bacterium]